MARHTDLKRDRRIDPEGLDVECLKQPDLFMKWSELAIEAKGIVTDLKLALETKQAELELRIRRRPEKFRLDKPTEAGIKATVLTHPEYLEAARKYHRAKDDAALLDAAVSAMEMKKKMLEELIILHGQQYFAGPSTPRDLKKVYLAQQAAVEKRIVIKQARKRGDL